MRRRAEDYGQQASELETAAKFESDATIRASYIDLALSLRTMAELARLDCENVQLAERMIGHRSGAA
jgi:hypothetical protein